MREKLKIFCKHFSLGSFGVLGLVLVLNALSIVNIERTIPYSVFVSIASCVALVSFTIARSSLQKKTIDLLQRVARYALLNSLTSSTVIVITLSFVRDIPIIGDLTLSGILSIYLIVFLFSTFFSIVLNEEEVTKPSSLAITNSNLKKYLPIALVVLITVGGFILRIYQLNYLTPYTDEFYHLLGAKRFFLENQFNYARTRFLTVIIGSLFKLHGSPSIYLARLPSVLMGTASIVGMYFVGKKVNKPVGILSSLLLAILPVAVGTSRTIREYSFFICVLLIMLTWFNHVLESLEKNFKSRSSILQLVAIISLPALYFKLEDNTNFIILFYFIIIIYGTVFLIQTLYRNKHRLTGQLRTLIKQYRIPIISTVTVLIATIIYLYTKVSWLISFNIPSSFFKLEPINYFNAIFDPSFSPWKEQLSWFSGTIYPTFFIFFLFLVSILYFRKNRHYISAVASFWVILVTFLYFTDRYYAIRYISYSFPLYALIFSCSIFTLFKQQNIFQTKATRLWYLITIAVFLITIFKPTTVIYGLVNERIAFNDPKTEMLGYDYPDLFSVLESLGFQDGNFVIASTGEREALAFYFNEYDFIENATEHPLMRFEFADKEGNLAYDYTELNTYYYTDPYFSNQCKDAVCAMDEITRIGLIANQHEHGWIIIDKDRNRNWNPAGFPLANFQLGSLQVEYKTSTNGYRGFDIYSW